MASWQLRDVKNRLGAVVIAWRSAKVVADVGDFGDRESRYATVSAALPHARSAPPQGRL